MDTNLVSTHGTLMVVGWMVFGSTGVFFARYGRLLRFGNARQFLGKSIWFQIHRFVLSLTSLLTLLAFFLIIVHRGGRWINRDIDGVQLFVHSIFGSIVVCSIILQIWLALYRCHPNSRYRFIFNWSHRIFGSIAFLCSHINLFVILLVVSKSLFSQFVLISLWTGWIILLIILFEIIQYQYRKAAAALTGVNARVNNVNPDMINRNDQGDIENGTNAHLYNQRLNKIKLILFLFHILISIIFSITYLMIISN